jgi:hypothetical protein
MTCFQRFLFWLNWGKMPESEESILRDLEKIGVDPLAKLV